MQAEVQDGVCGCMEFNTAAGREFCDRRFQWRFATGDAGGVSIGRTRSVRSRSCISIPGRS